MKTNDVLKAAVIGGVVVIIIEFLIGWAVPSISYAFGFVAMLLGGIIAGWMVKGKRDEAVVAGVVASLIYVILGLFIIYPLVSSYHSASPLAAIIIGIVLGAIGGFIGMYLGSGKKK
jgi:hypothetical protein